MDANALGIEPNYLFVGMPMELVKKAYARCGVGHERVHRHADEPNPTCELARSLTDMFLIIQVSIIE